MVSGSGTGTAELLWLAPSVVGNEEYAVVLDEGLLELVLTGHNLPVMTAKQRLALPLLADQLSCERCGQSDEHRARRRSTYRSDGCAFQDSVPPEQGGSADDRGISRFSR